MSTEKNYITPAGFARLQEELRRLKFQDRPKVTATVAWAAGNGDRSENGDYIYGKKKLREIDKRIEFLLKRLDIAEVVDPLSINTTEVRFGASVTIRDQDGQVKIYAILGVDEVDVNSGKISWRSPLGAALLEKKPGDLVTFTTPKGEQEVEVLSVTYK